jgi:uncharacterized protein YcfJ
VNRNTVLSALIVGGAAIAGAAAIAMSSGYNPLQKYATVVSVEPAFEATQTPRIVCGDEATLAAAEASTVGASPASASGQAADPDASAATATAKPGETEIPQCRTVFDTRQVEAGFDVTYELDGVQRAVRMDRDPGSRIPVEDGELVLSRL